MICQDCNERPATLHFTKVVNGEKSVIHLCERCAQEKGEFFMFDGAANFSVNDLLAGLLNIDPVHQKQSHHSSAQEIIQCDKCKMTFQQFIKIGRFGCAHCYTSFKGHLTPLLKRLHSGNITHGGKVPERIGGSIHVKKKIEQLRAELNSLVTREEFEKAADVRDQIRSLESNLASGEGNNI
ncbi:UvrB/UvrC motif-containing protein [Bacillus sp. FJAT-50079]|uniref:UvrB/UvrC motif-containing protein n=1 Tax=Bacillus sp. FJAT-50079 TaxID=2833577 RepID=UPI001BC9D877|nr:UvrB/UvrC motif-containing protein [Bacillus sp. FJAT-50079]MBS4210510.1 UvrB/UvrC motif-containing protein [Bacillus sp. FJAT-50079]